MKLPPLLISVLSIFARPIGQFILQGLTAASAAFVTQAVSYGVPLTTATNLSAAFVGLVTWAISAAAASQGVNIPVINADTSNGVRVVVADDARAAGLPKQDAPIPKA